MDKAIKAKLISKGLNKQIAQKIIHNYDFILRDEGTCRYTLDGKAGTASQGAAAIASSTTQGLSGQQTDGLGKSKGKEAAARLSSDENNLSRKEPDCSFKQSGRTSSKQV